MREVGLSVGDRIYLISQGDRIVVIHEDRLTKTLRQISRSTVKET